VGSFSEKVGTKREPDTFRATVIIDITADDLVLGKAFVRNILKTVQRKSDRTIDARVIGCDVIEVRPR
jgi:hypothetical protein